MKSPGGECQNLGITSLVGSVPEPSLAGAAIRRWAG
jgi:hypothetical protein